MNVSTASPHSLTPIVGREDQAARLPRTLRKNEFIAPERLAEERRDATKSCRFGLGAPAVATTQARRSAFRFADSLEWAILDK